MERMLTATSTRKETVMPVSLILVLLRKTVSEAVSGVHRLWL